MDRDEKANAVMQRAEALGFTFEFDSGFIRVTRPSSGDPERNDAIVSELGTYLPEFRRFVELRALAERTKDFRGKRVVFQDGKYGVLIGEGEGQLHVSIDEDGIRRDGLRSAFTATYDVKSLLIVLDEEEEADGAALAHDGETQSDQPRKGFFKRLRG